MRPSVVGLVALVFLALGCAASPRIVVAPPAVVRSHVPPVAPSSNERRPASVPPIVEDGATPGEVFAEACGTADFDHCLPFREERRAVWERAIAANLDDFEANPSSKVGLVGGVRAAIGLSVLGEPSRAAALFRQIQRSYAGDEALAPFEVGAGRGVDSDLAEYDARVDVIGPLLEHAATAELAALDLARAEEDYEAIARSPRPKPAARAAAIVSAMRLARATGDRERVGRVAKLAQALPLSVGERAAIDWFTATVDYAQWDANAPDDGPNRRRRIAALPSLLAFHARYRDVRGAAPFAFEAAVAVSELERAAAEPDRRVWLKRATDSWSDLDPTERTPERSLLAASATLALIDEDVTRDFDGWSGTCASASPASLFLSIDPDTGEVLAKGLYDEKVALADQYRRRIAKVTVDFGASPAVSGFFTMSGRMDEELRGCLVAARDHLPTDPYLVYRVDRGLEDTVFDAVRAYTMSIVYGGVSPAAARAQSRLAALAFDFGSVAVERAIRDTLGTGATGQKLPDELPTPGMLYAPRGARYLATPDLIPWTELGPTLVR